MSWVENATPEVEAQSDYQLIIAVTVVMTVLSMTVVCTRLAIRQKSGLRSDDWLSVASMICALAYSIIAIAQTKYGLGLPLALRPKENLITYTRVNFAGRPVYQMGISLFKVALLVSYLRLFQGTGHVIYRRVVLGGIVGVVLGHLGCSLSLVFACTPVHKSWDPLTIGTCLAPGPSFTAYAAVTIISDLFVTIVPIPMLLQLKINNGKKFGLIFIFVLGLFTTLCSVFRYMQINRIQYGDGNSTMLVLWGVIEFHVGNMVSSLPFLAPVFMRKAKEYRSRTQGAYGSSGKSGANSRNLNQSGDNNNSNSTGDSYKLSSVSKARGVFSSANVSKNHHPSTSEEDILRSSSTHMHRPSPSEGIVKSVTYSVSVEDTEFHMQEKKM